MNDEEQSRQEAMGQAELEALANRVSGEVPEPPAWRYMIDGGQDPVSCEKNIISIASILASTTENTWPSNDDWHKLLPQWFLDATPSFSREQADALLRALPKDRWDELPWDYSSWLAAVKERGWRWYSRKLEENVLTVYLLWTGWPGNIETFSHIANAGGGRVMSVEKV